MHTIEFTTELKGDSTLRIPGDQAAQLAKTGTVCVIVLTDEDAEDREWRQAAKEQFLRDDAPEDAIYGHL